MFSTAFHLLVHAADISRAFEATPLNGSGSQWAHVLLSCLIVGATLGEALKYFTRISSNLPSPRWAYSNWLIEHRMHRAGWCPKVVHTIVDSMGSKSLTYYLSSFKPHRQWDHSSCSSSVCLQNKIHFKTYRTLHVDVDLRWNRCTIEDIDSTVWQNLVSFVSRKETPDISLGSSKSASTSLRPMHTRELERQWRCTIIEPCLQICLYLACMVRVSLSAFSFISLQIIVVGRLLTLTQWTG